MKKILILRNQDSEKKVFKLVANYLGIEKYRKYKKEYSATGEDYLVSVSDMHVSITSTMENDTRYEELAKILRENLNAKAIFYRKSSGEEVYEEIAGYKPKLSKRIKYAFNEFKKYGS